MALTQEQQDDAKACSAFIQAWKDVDSKEWRRLQKDLDDIGRLLPGILDKAERERAKADLVVAQELRQRLFKAHGPALLAALVNGMSQVPPTLMADALAQDDVEARFRYLQKKARDKRIGYSRIRPETLANVQQKLLAYWIEGLQSSAFDALASLDNCLGPQPHFTSLGALLDALRSTAVEELKLDDGNPPVRTVVLKIFRPATKEKRATPGTVIATLPLAAKAHDDEKGPGFRWVLASDGVPAFNREKLGPAASTPGLLLENVEAFDRMTAAHLASVAEPPDLAGAMALWDRAFDSLVDDWPLKSAKGIEGWLAHFHDLSTRPRSRSKKGEGQGGDNPEHVWQVARWQAVFTLVDGSAVAGATAAVCNAYRHFLDSGQGLPAASRALFERVASLAAGPRHDFDVERVASDARRIGAYFGHMDSRDDDHPGRRSAYPLDTAQRDALLALSGTPDGEVLAVNGPPGTGKTSLLRGVIASAWVRPLLSAKRPDCPVIIACAATNQAVTNVISSFNETPGPALFDAQGQRLADARASLESRWLPALTSYGWYAPASLKSEGDAKKAGKQGHEDYQVIHRARVDDAWSFHGRSQGLGTLDLDTLENAYLACAGEYFGQRPSVAKAVERLHWLLLERAQGIKAVEAAAQAWLDCVPSFSLAPGWCEQDEQRLGLLDEQRALHEVACKRVRQRVDGLRRQVARLQAIIDHRNDLARAGEAASGRAPQLLEAGRTFDRCQAQVKVLQQAIESIEQWQARPAPGPVPRILVKFGLAPEQKLLDAVKLRVSEAGLVFDEHDPERTLGEAGTRLGALRFELQAHARRLLSLELPLLLADECADLIDGLAAGLPDAVVDACAARVQARLGAQSRELVQAEVGYARVDAEHTALEQARVAWQRNRDAAQAAHAELRQVLLALGIAPEKLDKAFGVELADSPLQELLKAVEEDADLQPCRKELVKRVQDLLDTEVRAQLFHFAARYWEGRYLQERRDDLDKSKDDPAWRASSARQLRTLAMLAPVFVVTAFAVPKLMRAQLCGFDRSSANYLFGEADLLIVDEAGQGSPEIGAAPFLFARRAIVVGDVEQLEPVWSISAGADGVHAAHYRLDAELDADDGEDSAFARLGHSGNLMSNGSVMRMAQRASCWTDRRFKVPGLTLTNHYRCLKPIIEVCNHLVYRGDLVPARREPAVTSLFRPELKRLAWLVVEEQVETRNPGGSRRNRAEAALIAAWLKENCAALLRHYDPHGDKGLRLKDVAAVVTPFTGQIQMVQNAMAAAWGVATFDPKDESQPYHGMTIDTVHSLQGAEKPVVLFSMVESSQPGEAQFYDRGSNLINVAISRAKDLFITALSQAAVDYARALPDPASDTTRAFKASDYLWHATVHHGSRLNARHLVLVESPNKCATIQQALGNSIEWAVCATQGNITGLADARHWSIRDAKEPRWQDLTAPAEKTLDRVGRLWHGLQSLYLATDPDSEGEQIAWQLLRILKEKMAAADIQGAPAIRRMRFHSLQEQDIRQARETAAEGLDAGMIKSALTRALLDALIAVEYPKRLGVGAGEAGYAAGVGRLQLGILDLVRRHAARDDARRVRVQIPVDPGQGVEARLLPRSNATPLREIAAVAPDKAQGYADACQERLQQAGIRSLVIRRRIHQLPSYPVLNTARVLALAWRAGLLDPDAAMEGLQRLYEGPVAMADEPDKEGN